MLLQVIGCAVGVLLAGTRCLGFDLVSVRSTVPWKIRADKAVMATDRSSGLQRSGCAAAARLVRRVPASVRNGLSVSISPMLVCSPTFRAVSLEPAHTTRRGRACGTGPSSAVRFRRSCSALRLATSSWACCCARWWFAGNFFTLLGFWAGGFNPCPDHRRPWLSTIMLHGVVAARSRDRWRDRLPERGVHRPPCPRLAVVLLARHRSPTPSSPVGGCLALVVVSTYGDAWPSTPVPTWQRGTRSLVQFARRRGPHIFPNLVEHWGCERCHDAGADDHQCLVLAADAHCDVVIAVIGVPLVPS
jgi:hypothetical protein